jgi:hypothetical protein
MSHSYTISKNGQVDIGPNIYATGLGLLTKNPWVTLGANVALAVAKGGYGAYQLSRKYGQLASLMYSSTAALRLRLCLQPGLAATL